MNKDQSAVRALPRAGTHAAAPQRLYGFARSMTL